MVTPFRVLITLLITHLLSPLGLLGPSHSPAATPTPQATPKGASGCVGLADHPGFKRSPTCQGKGSNNP